MVASSIISTDSDDEADSTCSTVSAVPSSIFSPDFSLTDTETS